jgi:hypothetical protein
MAFGKKDGTATEKQTEAEKPKQELEPTSTHLPADLSLADQIQKDLAATADQVEGSSVERIRMSGKGFTTPDGDTGETLECIIIDFASANNHYPEAFDRDNPTPPNCFAAGKIPSQLKPDAQSTEPQAESCAVCPKNQFESGVGKSKACKNTRVLGLMQVGAVADSPVWVLSVPPSSMRYFDTYVSTTLRGRHNITPAMCVTEVHMDPNKDFAAPRFKFVRLLEDAELNASFARKGETEAVLLQKPRLTSNS